MKRGGYKKGKVETYDCAACEPHEILLEIEELKDEVYNLERQISDCCFTDKEL